jgi:hypothetical protein
MSRRLLLLVKTIRRSGRLRRRYKFNPLGLDEIQTGADTVHSSRRIWRVGQTINKLLKRHRLNDIARLPEVNRPE